MFRRATLISEAAHVASTPIMLSARLWGLFPFTIKRRGTHYLLQWSKKVTVYSFVLGATLVILTIRGIVDDLRAGSNNSVRMKQEPGKYVTVVDISIVALIVFIGIFGAPFRVKDLLAYIDCINEVDSIIVVTDAKAAQKTSLVRLGAAFTLLTAVLCFDISIWWTIGDKSSESSFLIGNYVPFYVSYYIVLLLECQYWHLVHCIERRLRLLNDCLRVDFRSPEHALKNVENQAFSVFRAAGRSAISPRSVESIIDVLGKHKKVSDLFFLQKAKKVWAFTASDYIANLTTAYLKLCDAADLVNQCCGFPVLIILMSCLLHLVVTPYFMVLEISDRRNPLFITLQSIWLAVHLARLIIIVEACYTCIIQAKSIRPFICKLMAMDFSDDFRRQLELFATELYHREMEYTACGLVTINRNLITSIAGAVTTYLVILIQFQKNEK